MFQRTTAIGFVLLRNLVHRHCHIEISFWTRQQIRYAMIAWLWFIGTFDFLSIFIWWIVPSVLWHCWLGGRKGIWPVKTEWLGAGVVICLGRGADLHMAQLMPLPLTVSCFSKIQTDFTFLLPAHLGSPGKGPLNVCVCVCACACACVCVCEGVCVFIWWLSILIFTYMVDAHWA